MFDLDDFYNDSEMNLEAVKPNLYKWSELEEKSWLNQSKDEMDQHHDGWDNNLQNISDENDKKEQFISKIFSVKRQFKVNFAFIYLISNWIIIKNKTKHAYIIKLWFYYKVEKATVAVKIQYAIIVFYLLIKIY